MKNKKIIMYIGIILILIILLIIGYLIYINTNNEKKIINEYIPAEEITEEQLRQTIVTLYFMEKETGLISSEQRQLDVKLLINNPYKILIELLIAGPNNENLIRLIPDGTKLNNVELKENIIYLDLSKEFVNEQNLGLEQETLIIKSIVNTLTQLKEVEGVRILIDGEENLGFPDGAVMFNNNFTK